MGLALHCHGELKLKNGRKGRERDTKRKMELFPRALTLFQALQMCSSCLQNAKDPFPLAKREEKEPTCHISEHWHLAEGSHRQSLPKKVVANLPATVQRWPSAAKRWPTVAPGWRLSSAWRWRPVAPDAVFVSPGACCWYFCSSPCYYGSLICLDFWSKAFNLQEGHKKWGLMVYLDQCNPQCIYLQK